MNEYLRKGIKAFAVTATIEVVINLIINIVMELIGVKGFSSMSPEFRNMFPTNEIAMYANIFVYGFIGTIFAVGSFVFDIDRLGFIIQNIIYLVLTGTAIVGITVLVWQLHRYHMAMACTIAGYGVTYLIIGIVEYRKLKEDIRQINESFCEEL